MTRIVHRLIGHRGGASAAEFALVLPLLIIFLLGIIDVGRLMWTWNRAEKATQLGVRHAVVTDMVPATLATQNFAIDNGIAGGDPVPTSEFDETTCNNTSCTNDWGYNAMAFNNIVARMQDAMPEVQPANVLVEYENVGLGYAGDPHGPDVAPLVTVKLRDLSFTPLALMVFDASIGLPDFRAALTSEDGTGTFAN